MTIRTTYFGGVGSLVEPNDDDLILAVVRYPQDFIFEIVDRNVPPLSPPEDLLNAFKSVEEAAEDDDTENPSAIAWDSVELEERYREHLTGTGQQQVLENVRHLSTNRDVWLVCWEKDVRYCHRRVLADVLTDDLDVDVEHHPSPQNIEALHEAEKSGQRDARIDDFQGETA